MTQDKNTVSGRIVEVKFTFRENGVVVKTKQEENGWSSDVYIFPDGSEHKGAWYKDEHDEYGKLLKRSFLLKDGERRDAYFEDGELKKIIIHLENGKKKVICFNKTKDRVITSFNEDGLMERRMVWNADDSLISEQTFHRNGVMEKHILFNSKGLLDHVDVFDENGEKFYTEFPCNEKGEIRRRVYHNGEPHIEVYNSHYIFLYEKHLMNKGEYHSMRVYRKGDEAESKELLDKNGVVREKRLYCDGVPVRTEFLNTEGVVVGSYDYDECGNTKTARRLDDKELKYTDVPVAA